MQLILVECARSRHYCERGSDLRQVSLDEAAVVSQEAVDLVALDEALSHLAAIDPRKSQIVEPKFFSGLKVEETAEVL